MGKTPETIPYTFLGLLSWLSEHARARPRQEAAAEQKQADQWADDGEPAPYPDHCVHPNRDPGFWL